MKNTGTFPVTLLLVLISLASCRPPVTPTTDISAAPESPAVQTITPKGDTSSTAATNAASGFDCAGINEIPAAECEALVALYNNTNGPQWVDNSGWLSTNIPCSWAGIDCADGHVSRISLFYNQLSGPLPPELGNLSQLRVVELWVNQLGGPIPAELGTLSELVSLDLSVNVLTGPLPDELGNMRKLQHLSVAHNQIDGTIPSSLGRLENLDSLNLSHNQLNGAIPEEVGNLATLNLSNNYLTGAIPDSFDERSKLYELDLSYNQLGGSVPEYVTHIAQRTLWGNQLEGTITNASQGPMVVDYEGLQFSADPSLAVSIWPEVIPATTVLEGDPIWYAAPENIRFTFANPDLLPGRLRMGINLAREGQILIYPLNELAEIDPWVKSQIETLQILLAEQDPVPEDDLPLLPVTNAAQVFHAQAQYIVSGNIRGLRFVSQHSQEARPIINQELFYTFQGFTDDNDYYVAAFFPLTTADLPDTIDVEDWEAFNINYATYLSETTAVLDQLPPAEFTPDLNVLDEVVISLRVEPQGALSNEEIAPLSQSLLAPPFGLIYRTTDGLWRVGAGGEPQLLTERLNARPSPDGAHAVYMDDENHLWLIDFAGSNERQLATDVELTRHYQWGDDHTLLLGVWLAPEVREGAATGHVTTLDIGTGEQRVIDEEHLSLGRPALAPDGETVAYDVSPFYSAMTLTGYIYHPDSGSRPIDPGLFEGLEEEWPSHLYNPAWSPDNTQLAWLSVAEGKNRLVRFDMTEQNMITVFTWQPAQFGALPPNPVWSPDGQWLAVEIWANNEAESGLWLLAAEGDIAQRISATSSSSAVGSGPVWLSSHELAFIECDENYNDCETRLFDLDSETIMSLDLPPGSVVLIAQSAGPGRFFSPNEFSQSTIRESAGPQPSSGEK